MSDKNKSESPALANNWTAKPGCKKDMAPAIGSPSFKTSPNSNIRGKDGTRG